MKKTKLFIATLLVVATVSVAVVSCKKEKQERSSNNTEQALQSADNMDEYLISFKKKLLSAKKGGETISLEQAQRDLGNLLNFDFGDANYATDEYRYDTIGLELTLCNGQVDLSQLAITYNEAVNSILTIYPNIDLPEKSIYAISCIINEPDNRDGGTENIDIVLITRGFSGIVTYNHDTLDWRPRNLAGTCDGQFVGYRGAPEVMIDWLLEAQDEMNCLNGGRIYFTDDGCYETYGSWHYDTSAGKYKIFTIYQENIDTVCISHEDMEYYLANIIDLWNHTDVAGHFIKSIYILPRHFYNGIEHWWTWRIRMYHAKPNCTDTPPIH